MPSPLPRALIAIFLLLGVPTDAWAQLCMGRAPITAETPLTLGVDLTFDSDAQAVAAVVSGGNDRGFASGGVGMVLFDVLDETALATGVSGGAQLAVDQGRRVQVCPIGGVGFLLGPNDLPAGGGLTADFWSLQGFGGFHVGVTAIDAEGVQIVPTVGMELTWSRLQGTLQPIDQTETLTQTFGIVSGALGIVISDRFAITPTVSRSIGADDDSTSFRLALTVGFPR